MQLLDGTVIWDLPGGHTYITTPGSALLFPTLCAPTGELPAVDPAGADRCGDRTAMMPLRTTTRAQNRAHRIAAERLRSHRRRECVSQLRRPEEVPTFANDEPAPF
jgi:hypothetical protein